MNSELSLILSLLYHILTKNANFSAKIVISFYTDISRKNETLKKSIKKFFIFFTYLFCCLIVNLNIKLKIFRQGYIIKDGLL